MLPISDQSDSREQSLPIRYSGLAALTIAFFLTSKLFALDLEQSRKLLLKGDYAECIKETGTAISQRVFGEEWYLLKAEAELRIGQYKDAYETISAGVARYAWSVRLRQLGIDV